ncbi:MAG: 5'-methylthioadenosine/S-adenosylhomocysteine nucleosidase, partial [Clostridia bacterium]|nr:5'-methylthioadenosine/S-adenosylhomocysteine nucleosidase [Clostridia bacterium]
MIGAVIAMESEAEILLDNMEIENIQTVYGKTVHFGKAFGKDVLLVICGVGKVNAAVGACAAILKGADVVLNFGVAGGLSPERTEISEVYLIDKAVQYDFDLTQINGGEIGTLNEETENYLPLYAPASLDYPRRALASGDRFNDSPNDHKLLTELRADIRDMEGAAIAQVCKGAGIPCVSVKAISDVYGAGSTTEQYGKNLRLALLNL